MSWLHRLLHWRLSADWLDVRCGQIVCFAMAPALLVVAFSGLARLALTPGEAIIGVLASCSVAMQAVVIGLLLPLTHQAGAAPGLTHLSSVEKT